MKLINRTTFLSLLLLPALALADGDPDDLPIEIVDAEPEIFVVEPEIVAAEPEVAKARSVESSNRNQSAKVVSAKPKNSMQFYASDKSAELSYERTGPVFNLNNDRASAAFLTDEERDNAVMGTVMYDIEKELLSGLVLSFGPTVYVGILGVENEDVVALGGGIQAAYTLPTPILPVNLRAAFSYAPDVLTFGQSDRITDWNVRAGVPLRKNMEIFIGYRFLQFDTRPGDQELDKRVHVGVKWQVGK